MKLKSRFRLLIQYLPFTLNTLFFAAFCLLVRYALVRPQSKEALATNAHYPLVQVMLLFVFWFLLALVLLSILSAFATWFYFLWLRKVGKTSMNIEFINEETNGNPRQYFQIILPSVIRPMLGWVKGRLLFANDEMTDKFPILSGLQKQNSFFRKAIFGKSRMLLPDIKEYQLRGNFIFFEDMLSLISLPLLIPINNSFFNAPELIKNNIENPQPKKTDTLDIRIDELRKVEGDLLHYKDFESGDDVRRIVWKVFAKNRNLVVRIPEQMEPYASHLYFYSSFYSEINQLAAADYFAEMLNYYKQNVWTIYQALARKEWQMKYIPDQEFNFNEGQTQEEKDKRSIANSVWQNSLPLPQYFSPKKGTVLLISSLSNPDDVAKMLNECDSSVQIIFVKLSLIFKQYVALHWLKSIFIVPAPDRLSRLKSRWIFSPLRQKIKQNEKKIEAILKLKN